MTNPLEELVARRAGDGFNARAMLRDDREHIACWTCGKIHPLRRGNEDHDATDFALRHGWERGCFVARVGPEYLEMAFRMAERNRQELHLSLRDFAPNASVLEAFGTVTAVDLTAIGIAASRTAGWCSNWFDNSSGLYLDVVGWAYFQAVNTAKSLDNAIYIYGPGSFLTTDLPSNTAGNGPTNSSTTSAILTYNDISTTAVGWPLLKVCPYTTTNKPITSGGLYGFAKAHDQTCPKVVWQGLVNSAGPTIGTGGGTPTKLSWAGSYATIA